MSVHISSEVWRFRDCDSLGKLVLLKLADNANDDGVCWPSLTTISRETRLCRATVCVRLAELEKAGLLVRIHGERPSTVYRINLPIQSARQTSPPDRLVCDTDRVSPGHGLDQSTARTTASPPHGPEPSLNQKESPKTRKKAQAPEGAAKTRCSEVEAQAYVESIGLPISDGSWFFDKCEGNGWKNGGQPIKDWQATIRAWKRAGYIPSQKNGDSASPRPNTQRPNNLDNIPTVHTKITAEDMRF